MTPPTNAMTVDVEDYFQVSAMEPQVSRSEWDRYPVRVERNTEAVLNLFETHSVHATFFTLGWVAERYPDLVRRIAAAGHEIASHGFEHVRVTAQNPDAFRADIRRTRAILEEVSGTPVRGYRAASFSISQDTPWAHAMLAEEGYAYSSSVYPIRHDHYGMPEAPRSPYRPLADSDFLEIPISTLEVARRRLPCGGGGYFRLLPYRYSRWAIARLNGREGMPAVFYFHPWEIDPGQPRMPGLSARTRLRHYTNLERMAPRLGRLLPSFRWDRMDRVFLAHRSPR